MAHDAELEELQARHAVEINTYKRDVANHRGRTAEAQASAKRLTRELHESKVSVDSLTQSVQALTKQLDDCYTQRDLLDRKLREASRHVEELTAANTELRDRCRSQQRSVGASGAAAVVGGDSCSDGYTSNDEPD